MKGKMQGVSNAVNEALFDVALILATGLFRARQTSAPRCRGTAVPLKQDLTVGRNRAFIQ